MAEGILKIATCQFAVSASIMRNARQICEFMRQAADLGADIVHFPECALTGYIGFDFPNFDGFDWGLLKDETSKIADLAGELKLWVALGSVHKPGGSGRIRNCLYLVGPEGKIVDRYDKRFCTAAELRRFKPGNRFVFFKINGVKCSLLICFDLRFPELYRALYKQGVNCVLQSFYNARQNGRSVHTHIMRQTMQCHAATNHFWVSMSNASGYYSPYPSCFIQPDGAIVRQLRQNKPGIMVNTVDLNREFYDPMAGFREIAISGKLTNG
ncbi:MAG: carbon-nitrogen hydrolase family protein [Sedimentisphaerales bacterium]|nr:carbon-nitrogen hydrolase family protein [Sedimentisphaerales bacterium]